MAPAKASYRRGNAARRRARTTTVTACRLACAITIDTTLNRPWLSPGRSLAAPRRPRAARAAIWVGRPGLARKRSRPAGHGQRLRRPPDPGLPRRLARLVGVREDGGLPQRAVSGEPRPERAGERAAVRDDRGREPDRPIDAPEARQPRGRAAEPHLGDRDVAHPGEDGAGPGPHARRAADHPGPAGPLRVQAIRRAPPPRAPGRRCPARTRPRPGAPPPFPRRWRAPSA